LVSEGVVSAQQLPALLAKCAGGRITQQIFRRRVPQNDNAMPVNRKSGFSGYVISCLRIHGILVVDNATTFRKQQACVLHAVKKWVGHFRIINLNLLERKEIDLGQIN